MSLRDSLLAVLIVALWALHTVVIRIGVLEIPPLLLLTLRMAGTALVFAPFARKLSREEFRGIAHFSFVYIFLHIGLLAVGLRYLESSMAALFLQTTTPFAIVFGWLLHKEKFGYKTLLGLMLAFAGVLIILYRPSENFSYLGAAMILVSALFWGYGTVFGRQTASLDIASFTAYAHALPLPLFAALSFVFEPGQINILIFDANWPLLAGVLAYQVLIISLCHAWWRGLMLRNPVYVVACFSLMQPLLTVLFGHWLLGEKLELTAIIGGVISLAGVTIVMIRRLQRRISTVTGYADK